MNDTEDIAGTLLTDACVAGTLCLMSCYSQHPLVAYAERIASNLGSLAVDSTLTPEFRAICEKLSHRWIAIGCDARRDAAAGKHGIDTRPLH